MKPQSPPFFVFLIFLIILLVTASFLSAVLLVHTSPDLNVTVNSDKPYYYDGETVTIYGNLNENGNPVAGLVAIEVRTPEDGLYPEGRPYISRVIPTGSDPIIYDEPIDILNVWPSDDSGNPLSSFQRGQIAYFKVRIRNTAGEPQLVRLVTLNVFDANMIPLGVAKFGGIVISQMYQNVTLDFGEIPDDTSLGTATVYANHFTAWPSLGGSATGRERNASFQITESGGGGGGAAETIATITTDETYNLTFKLPSGAFTGYHAIHASARYRWEQSPTDSTIFAVTSGAIFTYSPLTPLVGETVTFNASVSTPQGGTIMNYTWNFADGNVTTVTNPVITHVYTAFGTYRVALNVTDSENLTDTFVGPIRILIRPVADFTTSPTQLGANRPVTFNATASYDPDRQIVNYAWNFGDGSPIFNTPDPVTTYKYTAENTYNVTLTVTDDDGLADTYWKLITVLYWRDVDIVDVILEPSTPEACIPPCGRVGVYKGGNVTVTITVTNNGTVNETFDVTAYYDNTLIGIKTVTDLAPLNSTNPTFTWDTTDVTPGNYLIKANATVFPEEINTTNNIYLINVKVKAMGDVNGDGSVDSTDLGMVGLHWPPGPYDLNCDFNHDGVIDSTDLGTLGLYWGTG